MHPDPIDTSSIESYAIYTLTGRTPTNREKAQIVDALLRALRERYARIERRVSLDVTGRLHKLCITLEYPPENNANAMGRYFTWLDSTVEASIPQGLRRQRTYP
jgi:hypothetical protein